MKRILTLITIVMYLSCFVTSAQDKDPLIEKIINEATENSQLKELAHELMDGIGPRLVGTPQMQQAHDWAVC